MSQAKSLAPCRRSRLKSVGCQLVYLDTQGGGQADLLWSPDGTLVCYTAADETTMVIMHVGRGTDVSVAPACGKDHMACFSPCSSRIFCAGNPEELVAERAVRSAVFIAVRDAKRVPVEIETYKEIQQVAWGIAHVAVASGYFSAGILALYAATDEPSLQLLREFKTGAYSEDLSFSPCGSFLSILDQGNFWLLNPLYPVLQIRPESQVVVVHVPTLQVRSFGTRNKPLEPEGPQMPGSVYAQGLRGRHQTQPYDELRVPARARLWWQGSQLLSYGPGTGVICGQPGPHKPLLVPIDTILPGCEMPCSRLELG